MGGAEGFREDGDRRWGRCDVEGLKLEEDFCFLLLFVFASTFPLYSFRIVFLCFRFMAFGWAWLAMEGVWLIELPEIPLCC